eukprot:1667217-Lingulodinium_polyedra.AAC.1
MGLAWGGGDRGRHGGTLSAGGASARNAPVAQASLPNPPSLLTGRGTVAGAIAGVGGLLFGCLRESWGRAQSALL